MNKLEPYKSRGWLTSVPEGTWAILWSYKYGNDDEGKRKRPDFTTYYELHMIHKHFMANFPLGGGANSILTSYDAREDEFKHRDKASYARIKRYHVEIPFMRQAWKNNWVTQDQEIGGGPVGTIDPPLT